MSLFYNDTKGNIFKPYYDSLNKLRDFVDLALYSLRLPDIIKFIHELAYSTEEEKKDDKSSEILERLERFINKEKEHGFPYLFELAIIRLWGILEAFVFDYVVHMLSIKPKLRNLEKVKK
jgi:hypothetical protein